MSSPASFDEFDFVIVDGGLCGLVLAARLSENPSVTVGVLECGPSKPNDPSLLTPSRALEIYGNPDYQSITETVPQKHLAGRRVPCVRGRMLGGGSCVNFMTWHLASKKDYDSIEALGNPGWNWESISKAARKSETFYPPDTEDQLAVTYTDARFHGTNGPVRTSFSGWIPKSQKAFFDVMEKFGLVKNDQWHNGSNLGIRSSPSSLDPKTGKHSSAQSAYYAPNASRANLSVLCGASAVKVELEKMGDLQVATGVYYIVEEKTYFVKARKEVILSAGALDSPHLLELSGIGDPLILGPLGINVKVNNANVGESLQDHVMASASYLTKTEEITQDALEDPQIFAKAAAT